MEDIRHTTPKIEVIQNFSYYEVFFFTIVQPISTSTLRGFKYKAAKFVSFLTMLNFLKGKLC